MLLVEHDMHFVMDLAHRIMAVDFGRVLAIGTPDVVRADASVIDAYLGVAS
jgi:branched-chain amino acid transport system ATP-binding protein